MGVTFTGGVLLPQGRFSVTSNSAPTWTTAAGTIGTEDEETVVSFQFEASDNEQGTTGFTFSKNSGDFPAGLSMDSAGLLTGTASDVVSDTTSNFNLRVTDNGGLFADEDFSMTILNVLPAGPQLWTWGKGYVTGENGNTNRSSPVQVGILVDWQSIEAGRSHVLAVKTDGTLWAWGASSFGQVGDNTTITRSSPVQIGSLTTWDSVSGGDTWSIAIKTDNTMHTWGNDTSGRLGNGGAATNRSTPGQLGGGGIWSFASAGTAHSLAIRTDNTLWGWGRNVGSVGDGTTIDRTVPVQVAGSGWTTVSAGSHSLGRKSSSLLAWGPNSNGQLGLGDTTTRSAPVSVGGSWASTSAGGFDQSAGVKNDGTLWTWGRGNYGQLGLGDVANRSSPTQVGVLNDWVSVYVGKNHTLALKTDGTLWGWGDNSPSGQIGDGTVDSRSSPVQISILTDWTKISAGGQHSTTIRTTS